MSLYWNSFVSSPLSKACNKKSRTIYYWLSTLSITSRSLYLDIMPMHNNNWTVIYNILLITEFKDTLLRENFLRKKNWISDRSFVLTLLDLSFFIYRSKQNTGKIHLGTIDYMHLWNICTCNFFWWQHSMLWNHGKFFSSSRLLIMVSKWHRERRKRQWISHTGILPLI
jgi:hypothetical protein